MKSLRQKLQSLLAIINSPMRKDVRHLLHTATDLTTMGCQIRYMRLRPGILIEIDPPAPTLVPTFGNIAMMSSDRRGEIIYSALRGPVRIQWRTPAPNAQRQPIPTPRRNAGRGNRFARAT